MNYRNSILNDIFASVDRLPQSKRNMRPYKLSHNGGSIQMITALVLQLIQSSTVLPDTLCDSSKSRKKINQGDMDAKFDKDVIVKEKHDIALSIGGNFLTTFLDKCKSRSSETDFRPLFENFITDLLTTVNRPEWPASELLLSLLGTLLVKYMSDKTMDQSIRVVSLEYLGIVAARLRKDTVESRCKVDTMDQLIKCIKLEQEKENDLDNDEVSDLISLIEKQNIRSIFFKNEFLFSIRNPVQNRSRSRRRAHRISSTDFTRFFGCQRTRRQSCVRLCSTFLSDAMVSGCTTAKETCCPR